MSKKKTTAIFIEEAVEIHGDKYDYNLVEYRDAHTPVKIFCKMHKEIFMQKPSKHVNSKQDCPKCGIIKNTKLRTLSFDDFRERANAKHESKYIYTPHVDIALHAKIDIICPIHQTFRMTIRDHLSGQGCPKCGKISMANKRRLPIEAFVERAHAKYLNIYDYSFVEYKNGNTPVKIICKYHGIFEQTPGGHLGFIIIGCPTCAITHRNKSISLTQEEFSNKVNAIYGDTLDFSQSIYKNINTSVDVLCKKHGIFKVAPSSLIYVNQGCLKCSGSYSSKLERKWLAELQVEPCFGKTSIKIDGKRFKPDGYRSVPSPTIYEFLGDYWHGNPTKFPADQFNRTVKRTYGELYTNTISRFSILTISGYEVVYVWEDDFKNGKLFSDDIKMIKCNSKGKYNAKDIHLIPTIF